MISTLARYSTLVLVLTAMQASAAPAVEAFSLDGRPLHRPTLDPQTEEDFNTKLTDAVRAHQHEPSADNLIWLGRRTAYLGRYREAIDHFTSGVQLYPRDPRFLRHRGHRHITVRKLDAAIRDLSRAADLVEGRDDEVEPDGLPNSRGIPTSTLQTNIYYHLGLAHYLQGSFNKAIAAWERCLDASKNPDMEAATRYWLYLAQRRAGKDRDAEANLMAVNANWDIIENEGYHRLLLLYRGDLELGDFAVDGDDGVQNATLAYGLAQHQRFEGADPTAALRRIVEGPAWAAFGYIAAEADLTQD